MNRGKSGVRARRWMPPSRVFDQGGHDVIATMIWCAKKRFDVEFHRFLIWMFVILGSGEDANGFVSLLNLGQHWSGWSSRHDHEQCS